MADQLLASLNSLDLNERGVKSLVTGFAAIGTYYLGLNAYAAMRGFVKYLVLPRRNLKVRYGGGWALVTGASDGIGKAYCHELAKSGFNIILMARNADKIKEVAKELREAYTIQTKQIIYNFDQLASEQSAEELRDIIDKLYTEDNLDISILVNNVGCAKWGSIDQQTIQNCLRQINVNINSQTYMSMFILPRLLARETRSAIINVSSSTAYQPNGMVAIYSATKSYNWTLSMCMADAYKSKLDVLTVVPGSTKTLMNSGRYCFSISAERHAKATIDQLGWWQNETRGSYIHALQPRLKAFWPIGFFVEKVNAARRETWLKEEEEKKNQVLAASASEGSGIAKSAMQPQNIGDNPAGEEEKKQ